MKKIKLNPKNHCVVNHGFNIFTIDEFLSLKYCHFLLNTCLKYPLDHVHQPRTRDYASRDSFRSSFRDEELARCLWIDTGLNKLTEFQSISINGSVRPVFGLNPMFRLYKYLKTLLK